VTARNAWPERTSLMEHRGPHIDTQPQTPHLGPVKLYQLHNFILPPFLLDLTSSLTYVTPFLTLITLDQMVSQTHCMLLVLRMKN